MKEVASSIVMILCKLLREVLNIRLVSYLRWQVDPSIGLRFMLFTKIIFQLTLILMLNIYQILTGKLNLWILEPIYFLKLIKEDQLTSINSG
jgi:hypothetical protein